VKSRFAQAVVFVALFTTLYTVLFTAAPALADPFNDATLTVTPNPAVFTDSNAYFEFTGCGYDPSTGVQINVQGPAALSFFGGPTDSAGCISITWNGFVTGPGTYEVEAVQSYVRGVTGRSVTRAGTTLVVTN
jgi:hypothetical protein